MMNRLFKRGMVIALAAAMTTSAGIPAMAAQKETLEETVTTSEVTQTNVDYGSLTQKEIEEFNSIYDRLDAIDKEVMKDADGLSDEDIYARYDQYQDETDTLMDRLEELDKKAGWIDNEEYEYSEDECNALYDTGKLTAEEAEQLQKAYERIEEIDAEVWTDDDLSDDEIEARLTVFTIKLMQSMTIFITALITSRKRNLLLAMRSIQMRLMLWRHRQSLLKRKQSGTKIQIY